MANNNSQVTLHPTNLKLTNLQKILLQGSGAQFESNDDTTADQTYYVFWPEFFWDELDSDEIVETIEYFLLDEEEEARLNFFLEPTPENPKPLRPEIQFFTGKDIAFLLRDILRGNKLEFLRLDGAFSCSKMRPGEFGGFSLIVTEHEYCYCGSYSLDLNKDGKIEPRVVVEKFVDEPQT